jgi:hypothetical protein
MRFDLHAHAARGMFVLCDPTTVAPKVARSYEAWIAHLEDELARSNVLAYDLAAGSDVSLRVLVDEPADGDLERLQSSKSKQAGILRAPSGRLVLCDAEVAGIAWDEPRTRPVPVEIAVPPGIYDVLAFEVDVDEDDDPPPPPDPPNVAVYLRRLADDADSSGRTGCWLATSL